MELVIMRGYNFMLCV